jgi:hypothetical protein
MADASRDDDRERLAQQALIDLETTDSVREMRLRLGSYLEDRTRDLNEREAGLNARQDVADSRDGFARLRQTQQDARDAAADQRDTYLDQRTALPEREKKRSAQDRS